MISLPPEAERALPAEVRALRRLINEQTDQKERSTTHDPATAS